MTATKKNNGKQDKIELCALHAGIKLDKTIEMLIPGWINKVKGMLQLVSERGFIDPSKYDPRTENK